MGGIGIVNNPRSRRNRRHPETAGRLRRLLDGEGEVLDAATPDELDRAVERFRALGIDVLGVNGGDGTGHVVLTAVARAWGGAPLPRLALLRGGAMNTVAHGHAIRGTPERIVRSLLDQRRAGRPFRTVDRDLLRVDGDGEPPRFGFIFGTGIVVAFLEAYYGTGRPSPAMAALLLGRAVGSVAARGPFARALLRRERLRVVADGEEWAEPSYLALLAASVPDIGFGFRVFSRCDEQPGFFHAIGVSGSLPGVALALPRLRAGRPWSRRLAIDAVARELRVEGDDVRYTLDGDLYLARHALRVSTGPGVEVVLP